MHLVDPYVPVDGYSSMLSLLKKTIGSMANLRDVVWTPAHHEQSLSGSARQWQVQNHSKDGSDFFFRRSQTPAWS